MINKKALANMRSYLSCRGNGLMISKQTCKEVLQASRELSEAKALLTSIKNDLLARAEVDSQGSKVVNLGATNWRKLNEFLKDTQDE